MSTIGTGLIINYTYCQTTYIILGADTFIAVSRNKDTGSIEVHENKGMGWITNEMKTKRIGYSQELLGITW